MTELKIKFDIKSTQSKIHRTKAQKIEIQNRIIEIINSFDSMPSGQQIIRELKKSHPTVKDWFVYSFLKSLREGN